MRYAVIMAGGSGTRLWPMSRSARPKQLLPLINGESLLQVAARRARALVPAGHVYVCAAERDRAVICRALNEGAGPWLDDAHYLGEPVGRDTVNAVAFACAAASAHDPDAVLAVLTSDHLIEPQEELERAFALGFRLVEADPARLVTFAVKPSFPATGYGYVERGGPVPGFEGAFAVRHLVEKPDRARAEQYLAAGTYGWNSGMFVFHAGAVLEVLERLAPEVAAGARKIQEAWRAMGNTRGGSTGPRGGTCGAAADARAVLERIYPTLPKISVDYALMEPASRDPNLHVTVVPMNVNWTDVGNWTSLAGTLPADAQGNRTNARAVHLESRNVTAVSENPKHVIATVGLDDVVVVHTPDATLVVRADLVERVKEIAELVPEELR